jgi:hypothetical protein
VGPVIRSFSEALAGTVWGMRWLALAVVLYSFGQPEPWPGKATQIAACVMLTAMTRIASAAVIAAAARRRTGLRLTEVRP